MLKVRLLRPEAKAPTRAHNSAGYDLYAAERTLIPSRGTRIVKTGIATDFPPGYVALIWDRSGMGAKGIHRFAGVIDADYRGEWGIVLHNTANAPFRVEAGDRIAQVLFQEVAAWPVEIVEELDATERGVGGFGSTGR